MTTRAELRNHLLRALAAVVDEPLRKVGFARNSGSLTFARTLNASEQQITFVMDCFPKYQPDAEAHIHPMLQLRMSRVSAKALALLNGDKSLLADAPEIIVNQPIEFTAPKAEYRRWFIAGSEQFGAACDSIRSFLTCWVLPFLSEVSTIEDLIKLYEKNDDRIMKQRHWYVFIAAAYEEMGEREAARNVVRQQFSGAGLRRRYGALFASLDVE